VASAEASRRLSSGAQSHVGSHTTNTSPGAGPPCTNNNVIYSNNVDVNDWTDDEWDDDDVDDDEDISVGSCRSFWSFVFCITTILAYDTLPDI